MTQKDRIRLKIHNFHGVHLELHKISIEGLNFFSNLFILVDITSKVIEVVKTFVTN